MALGELARILPGSRLSQAVQKGFHVMDNGHALKISELDRLRATGISTLQINLGPICNQHCNHCHLEAGPDRTEAMSSETVDMILELLGSDPIQTLDITGGAPELHSEFLRLVAGARPLVSRLIDRCNLTVLILSGQEDTAKFLGEHQVEIIASLPCYTQGNVDAARGSGAFDTSIAALKKLNAIGYGSDAELVLNLVYNPIGPKLPASAQELEEDYKCELDQQFGVRFNQLQTMANAPIGRFERALSQSGGRNEYLNYLANNFNPETVPCLMCRHMISVGWDGRLYDCDFNLALSLPVNHGAPDHISDFDYDALRCRRIVTGDHCLACTAGAGSSCGGELVS